MIIKSKTKKLKNVEWPSVCTLSFSFCQKILIIEFSVLFQ